MSTGLIEQIEAILRASALEDHAGVWEVRAAADSPTPAVARRFDTIIAAHRALAADGWQLSAAAAPPIGLDGLDETTVLRYQRASSIVICARVASGRDGMV